MWLVFQNLVTYTHDNSSMLTLCLLFCTRAMVKYVAISLEITSTCRQKKRYMMRHVNFAAIHQNFTNAILYTICDYLCENRPYWHI